MSSAIPSDYVKENPSFFQRVESAHRQGGPSVYRLDPAKLSPDECHMFFPVYPCAELVISATLEYVTFHPSDKRMNDKFDCAPISIGDVKLFWCHFPKEFKDTCVRAGKLFHMTQKTMSRVMVGGQGTTAQVALEFPAHENLICFEGRRTLKEEQIFVEQAQVMAFGDSLTKMDVD